MDRRFYMRKDPGVGRVEAAVAALRRQTNATAKAAAPVAAQAAQAVTASTTMPFVRFAIIPAQSLLSNVDIVVPFYRTMPDASYTVDPMYTSFGASIATVAVKTKTTTSMTVTVSTLLALSGGVVFIQIHY